MITEQNRNVVIRDSGKYRRGGNREIKSGDEGQGKIGARTSSFYMEKAQESVPKVVCVKVAQSCSTLCDPMDLYSPWNSAGQNTGVGSLSLPQGIFQPRDQTQVSRIAGKFFTS